MKNDYDEDYLNQQAEFERKHPVCPECGAYMSLQEETYGLTGPYKDRWYECCSCGYCMEA